MATQREIPCPFCSGQVLVKNGGRAFSSISGFLQRSFAIRIPTNLLSYIQEKLPVSKKEIIKGKCEACDGKGTIKDPSDDNERYNKVKQNAESKSKEIIELEGKLAPPCGNRYTIIQGCDLLEVGLGMNDAPSYRVDKEKSVRNKGLIDPSKTNTKKGGPQIPEGGKANHVQGLNPLASPGGHYLIKCSNKFSILVGAQGIDINTGGPIVINGGITKITGPEITIGTQTGRLSLQGDVVDISGKSVEIAPTDGHFFVKGTISNTGNLMVGGHNHSESLSFVKAECIGRNEITKPAAPSDMYSGPAFWGSISAEGVTSALKDLAGFVTSKTANPTEAQQLLTPRFVDGLRDKVLNLTYTTRPRELKPSGIMLPGECVVVGTGNLGFPVTCTNPQPILLYNFPHIHALPDLVHTHEVRIPDIDCSADSAQDLRNRQGGVSANAPLHKTSASSIKAAVSLFQTIGSVFVGSWRILQGRSGPFQK